MKAKAYNLTILLAILCIMVIAPQALAETSQSQEYSLKAAFLYNFVKFVEWPREKLPDSNEPITIGLIGKDPFHDAFEVLKDKHVIGRNVVINRFKGLAELQSSSQEHKEQLHPDIETIRKCHLLFICASEQKHVSEIVNSVQDYSILTIGDMNGFLRAGGIINFIVEEKKVRFEINVIAAKQAKIKIRSKLLRLAKRVIE